MAKNSKEMHLVTGSMNDPKHDLSQAFFFFFSENQNKLSFFILSKRNFKENFIKDFKHSHWGEFRSDQRDTIKSSFSSEDKRILKIEGVMQEYLWKILTSVLLQDCV